MPKNKKGHPSLEDLLERPWCYYCERDFEDLKILIDHQKHKHFKCERCNRRLNTAGGLAVHLNHVHKETLGPIENALPNRSGHETEIFGMEGIPDEVANAHRQRVISGYAQAEAERRVSSGNTSGGTGGNNPAKKPKTESVSEMKKRLAEHKAKKAAEEAAAAAAPANNAGLQSGETMNGQQMGFAQVPVMPPQGVYPGQPNLYNGASGTAMYGAAPQPYGQPNPAYPQQPPFQAHGAPFPNQPQHFNQPTFQQPQPFPQAPFPQQFPNGQPQFQGGHPQSFSPNNMMHTQNLPQGGPPMPRPGSIGPAPGLPQRPSFAAPPVNASQMQQMHQGMIPNAPTGFGSMSPPPAMPNGSGTMNSMQAPSGSAEIAAPSGSGAPLTAATENGEQRADGSAERKSKKDKDKDVRMVYSDNEISPEEKMAKLPRYAFDPAEHKETVLREALGGGGTMVYTNPPAGLEDGP